MASSSSVVVSESVVESIQEVVASNENLDVSLEIKAQEKVEALRQRGEPVSILVIGPTGSGKSTLVNALMGSTVAEVGHGATSVTVEVKKYEGEFKGVKMNIYVTIGFRDSEGKSDGSILKGIAAGNKLIDLVLVCMKLEERVNRDTKKVFVELARSLRIKELWRTIVVATFANMFIHLDSVPESNPGRERAIKDKISDFQSYVYDCLNGHFDNDIIRDIPYCIAGKARKRKLPTSDDWLKDLWSTCIARCSDEAQPFLMKFAKNSLSVGAGARVRIGAWIGAVAGAMAGAMVGTGVGTAIIGPIMVGAISRGAGAIVAEMSAKGKELVISSL